MKPYVPSHRQRCWCYVATLTLLCSTAFGEGGIVDQSVDALYNLHDQLQDVVMKSVKGVGDAMQEGPPPDPGGKPWTKEDLQQIQQKNQNLYDLNKTLAQNQQKLLELDKKILDKLPPDDPRRKGLTAEMKQVGSGLDETRDKARDFKGKVVDANNAIEKWKAKDDSTYVPKIQPKPKPKPEPQDTSQAGGNEPTGPVGPPGPIGPSEPAGPSGPTWTGPTGPVGGGGGGGNIDAWKAKEMEIENKARALGKEREQAVIDYLNDPSPENKERAAELKGKLDGLVNKLNKVRGKVDGLTGGSRPPLKTKTAKQIKNKWQQGGGMAGGGEDHHHNPDGTDVSSSGSGSEEHHHNPDGTDAPYKTVSGTGSDTGAANTAGTGTGKRGGGKRRKANVASSTEGHSHGPGGMDVPNNQATGQNVNRQGRKRRYTAAQTNQMSGNTGSGMSNAQYQQQLQRQQQQQQQLQQYQAQNQNRQRRKKQR